MDIGCVLKLVENMVVLYMHSYCPIGERVYVANKGEFFVKKNDPFILGGFSGQWMTFHLAKLIHPRLSLQTYGYGKRHDVQVQFPAESFICPGVDKCLLFDGGKSCLPVWTYRM